MANLKGYLELDPLARGKLFKQVKEEKKLSYKEIAEEINKSPSYVANSVRLLNLPIAIKDGLLGKLITEGHARALASLNDQRDCVEVYKEVLKNHASVRETEQMVRDKREKLLEKQKEQAQKVKKALQKVFKQKFDKAKLTKTKDRIKISLYR